MCVCSTPGLWFFIDIACFDYDFHTEAKLRAHAAIQVQFEGWDGVQAPATMPRDIMAPVIMARIYIINSVWRIVLKWRMHVYASQNDSQAH